MKMDTIILKRFQELEDKSKIVRSSIRTSEFGYRFIDQSVFHEWSNSVMNILYNIFGELSIQYQNFKTKYDIAKNGDDFDICYGIYKSAKEDYEGGYVFNMRSLVSIEVLDSVIEQADQLLSAGYKDVAAVVIGIVLETSLKELCNKKNVQVGKLDRMNAELSKAGYYNVGMQKMITAWADIRNNAAHGNWGSYKEQDVIDMKNGVIRFLADYL
ncbi:hypothetical protein [Cohnella sp. 56]|uniref:hypothetical protein n=1 Tax=Cohnella sp. 56 TaxID=3113722 RepID=UPI0030E98209